MEGENSINVLIADTEQAYRSFIRRILETQGDLRVIGEAADGNEVVHLAEQLRPDVVLFDMGLLGGGSFDGTRQIKASLPETRIIMLSVLSEEAQGQAATKYGADAYVSKTAPIPEILAAIRRGEAHEAA